MWELARPAPPSAQGAHAKNIQLYSALPHGDELLLSPNMEFLVTTEVHTPSSRRASQLQGDRDATDPGRHALVLTVE